ncbi:DinB family protein [Actinophytocola sp.]|uniref:DinB family protein n=1 Tax=Actinophytocola sp. TaxID=1872138 RepID=UPI00389AADF3
MTCIECGFSYDAALDVPTLITAGVSELAAVLTTAEDLRSRRSPETWSPLEYACHVRDMLLVQRERVLLARRVETPDCTPMGRDERVEHDGYADQNPADVARQLSDAALLFTNVLRRLTAAAWAFTVLYRYPEPTERTLHWVALHTLHEVQHHLLDVQRQLT